MSLISQNIPPKSKAKKTKRENINDLSSMQGNEDAQNEYLDVSRMNKKKRRKEHNEENEKLVIEQEREMKKLENSLFGSLYSPVELGKEDKEAVQDKLEKGAALFIMDCSANSMLSVHEEDAELSEISNDKLETKQRKPVWVDEEEDKANINIAKVNRLRKMRKEKDESLISGSDYVLRLRAQHIKLNPGTEWAQFDSSTKLVPGRLEYSRLVNANAEDPSNAPINSVQFHRNLQLLLAAGLDRRLRFFQIDGKRNTKIQSIFLDDCPIRKASFLPDGSQVIVAGRRKFFYSLDLVKAKVDKIGPLVGREEKSLEVFEVSPDSSTIAFVGTEGYILLVSTKMKELIGTLKDEWNSSFFSFC
ncbi:u3 small nucleolar rna-associated protein 18 like protein [Quercus suber]|uniref:U3 small nucleolar rna-associated protein 18 like protein n=1 Tax=Quercus suber TaxID=58331 RepID=A0AAW0IU31_QUESU